MSYSDGASTYDKLSDGRFTQALYGGHTWAHFTELKGAHLLTTTSCCRHTQTMARTFCIVTTITSRTAFSKPQNCGVHVFYLGHSKMVGVSETRLKSKLLGNKKVGIERRWRPKEKKEVGWKEDRLVR